MWVCGGGSSGHKVVLRVHNTGYTMGVCQEPQSNPTPQ